MGDVVMFRALLVIQSATRRLERWRARKKNTVKGIRDAKNTVSGNDATETDQRRDLDLVVFFAVVLVVVFTLVRLPLKTHLLQLLSHQMVIEVLLVHLVVAVVVQLMAYLLGIQEEIQFLDRVILVQRLKT